MYPDDRLTKIEELQAHLEHLLEQLSEQVIAQGKRLDGIERELLRVGQRCDRLDIQLAEPGDPRDEKPPHY